VGGDNIPQLNRNELKNPKSCRGLVLGSIAISAVGCIAEGSDLHCAPITVEKNQPQNAFV